MEIASLNWQPCAPRGWYLSCSSVRASAADCESGGQDTLVINTPDPCGFAYALGDMMLHAGTYLRMKCDGTLFTFSSENRNCRRGCNLQCLFVQPGGMNNAVGRSIFTPEDSLAMLGSNVSHLNGNTSTRR